jgi:hypothetical protein
MNWWAGVGGFTVWIVILILVLMFLSVNKRDDD